MPHDYRELVHAINRATNEWDLHIASCQRCAIWFYFGKNHSPPCEADLCDEGRQIVQAIVLLLS